MFYFICLLMLFILVGSFIRTRINVLKQIHLNEMNRLHDEMEVFVYTHSLQNKKEVLSFILPFKNFVINTGYVDIEVLIVALLKMHTEKTLEIKKKNYDENVALIPHELMQIAEKFDFHLDKAISLSIFRAGFVIYFIKELILRVVKSIIDRRFKKLTSFFRSLREVYKYESIIASGDNWNRMSLS
jgi:hypothetical protein